MPAPERMLTHLRQAVALVRATPGRRGHTVALDNCAEVLVAGDLHGHVPNFQAVWKLADQGKIRPRVHAELPLEQWREAFDLLANRQVIGKAVITP